MKIRFEILLENNPGIQQKAIKEIEEKFSTTITPLYDENNFFQFEIDTPRNSWDIAREIIVIDGVLDVDPIIPTELEDYVIDRFNLEFSKKGDEEQFTNYSWFIETPRFQEAIQYATQCYIAGTGFFDKNKQYRLVLLDTGYTDHPEVQKFNRNEGRNFISGEDPNDARDTLESTRPVPIYWGSHGTSCAGILIGSTTNNIGIDQGEFMDKINGVLPNLDIVPYRISKNIISFNNNLVEAKEYFLEDPLCKVISMSHASLLPNRARHNAVKESYEKGVILVAAAGSHVHGFKRIFTYPAKHPEAVAAAASTINNEPWIKTHGGSEVVISAPGFQIYIPYAYRDNGHTKYSYKLSEGSSFAAPLVASAAVLWRAHHGEQKLNQMYPQGWQIVEAFKKCLSDSATPFLDPSYTELFGSGILNVENLLKIDLPQVNELKKADENKASLKLLEDKKSKADYITQKELSYLTCIGKIETEDVRQDELYRYVEEKASLKAKSMLKDVEEEGKVTNTIYPEAKINPRSEALKRYVNSFIDAWY